MEFSMPEIKSDVQIRLFDESSIQEKYLISIDSQNFVVSKSIVSLIDDVRKFHNGTLSCDISVHKLKEKAEKHLPKCIIVGTPAIKAVPPFIVSVKIIPEHILCHMTKWLQHLISYPKMVTVFIVFMVLHSATLMFYTEGKRESLSGSDGIMFFVLFISGFLIHELGHASACKRFGEQHGAIGFGIYVIFPAFYADVTNSWKLECKKRAIIDVAGLYFQSIFLLIIDTAVIFSENNIFVYVSIATSLTMLHTLNPFFKFDGYWLLSDLSGITNLHEKVRSTIYYYGGILLRRKVKQVKPEERMIVNVYTVLMVLFVVFMIYIISSSLIHYAQFLPEQIENWFVKYNHVTEGAEKSYQVLGLLHITFIPLLMVLSLCFYSYKMYCSFFIPVKMIKK